VAHCPTTALKVAYGVTQIGKMPEMVEAGVNVTVGTDGNNASNYSDLMRATYLVAGLFKDARRDPNARSDPTVRSDLTARSDEPGTGHSRHEHLDERGSERVRRHPDRVGSPHRARRNLFLHLA